jgi:phosphoglycerate dehydrogenase-like enzyme
MSPTQTHFKIVATQTFFYQTPPLELPAPFTYDITEYTSTQPGELVERIRDADIITITTTLIPADVLDPTITPRLKAIFVVASGFDCVDLTACRARGIHVANTPHCNTTSVAEHVMALYFAARRSLTLTNNLTRAGEWPRQKTLIKSMYVSDDSAPRTLSREVMGIIGYGAVGTRIEALARAMGMKVLISGRKGDASAPEGRATFDTVIRQATVIVVCCPRSPDTLNLISEAEFSAMSIHAVLVNVSRGGVVDEQALVEALKARKIAGAATDVYEVEPVSSENSPLLGPGTAELNLVTTPHVAWIAEDTIDNYMQCLKENVASWLLGNPKNCLV